jgi:AbiV family abortive infection protein
VRLVKDAKLLLENERHASALALAILAIEETGKEPVLRGLAVAPNDSELKKRWREYRTHTAKNAHWPVLDLFFKGARRLEEFLPMYQPKAKHPEMLDIVKQLSLYTDSFKKGHWSVPEKIIQKDLAEGLVKVAEIFSQTREITAEEIDLWIRYLKPAWYLSDAEREKGLIDWDKEMRKRGLIAADAISAEEFITVGLQPRGNTTKTAQTRAEEITH